MGSNSGSDLAMRSRDSNDVMRSRITDAAVRCVSRWGVAKTTLEDIAREAGCGRATIYRTFSGGKAALFREVAVREVVRAEAAITEALEEAATLEDLLVAATVSASRAVRGHAAFQFLLAHEPEVVLPFMSFERLDVFWREATRFATPHLARFVPESAAARAAEWAVRVILTYTLHPSEHIDPTVERDARRLVRTYLLPAIRASEPHAAEASIDLSVQPSPYPAVPRS